MKYFEGIHVALVTPMTEDYEVDYRRLYEISEWMIEKGIHGLIPGGSLGEYAVLSNDERAKVVETVIDAAKGRVPVSVGSGAPATSQVVKWCEHAKGLGASGIMALPPINYKPLEHEIVEHYRQISNVGLPVIAYNNPRDYPTDLTPEFLAELEKIENIVAVKEFSGDVRRVHDILEKTSLEVLIGVDDLSLEGPLMGATGWIAGVPNALPEECLELFQLAREGNLEKALPLYRSLLPLFHYDAIPQLVQAIKYMMELNGQPVGPTRPPRLKLDDKMHQDIKHFFDKAQSTLQNQ